jgi:hypothetical protein
MAELRRVTAEDITRRVAALGSELTEPTENDLDPIRWSLREAAALLGAFDAGSLHFARKEPRSRVLREFIVRDCERVGTRAGTRWRLLPPAREETIRRMKSPKRLLMSLRMSDPDPIDIGRTMAEAYLRGTAPPLERQSFDELQGSLQAVEWLAPADLQTTLLPSIDDVRAQLAISSVLQPLRTLAGDEFVDRVDELRRLADYVEVLPPGSVASSVVRTIRRVFRLAEKPPLVIYGPGGMGKSTLVARFVLEHSDLGPDRRFPFAYLSFDRADLVPHRPLTLLAAAVRQLAALYPKVADSAAYFEQSVRSTLLSGSAASDERETAMARKSLDVARGFRDEAGLLNRFGALVESAIGSREMPYLWVLDTFEVAQRHGPRATERLWGFLDEVQGELPRLRVVFAGRAPLHGYRTEDLLLGGLSDELAVEFLRRHLDEVQVAPEFLRSVSTRVGANPLSLKLAAELLRQEGERGLGSIQTRRRILFKLGPEEIQGLLYRRILDHLDDPDVRKIANPGLVVRRISPDVISNVLAIPCGLGQIDSTRAWDLFELLKKEASLVQPVGSDVVVHRPDVRRTMLPLLERDNPERVRSIHRRAVRFYQGEPGTEARTEELYHRLSLGQSTSTLDRRWDPEAGQLLEDALEELPPAGRVYLADRLGFPIEPDVLVEVDDAAWARQAARVAREMIDSGRADEALALVRQRRSSTARAGVTDLEIEALATMGQVDKALSVTNSALSWAIDEGRAGTFVDIAVLGARIAEDHGMFKRALRWVEQARDTAEATGDDIAYLGAATAELRLNRRLDTADSAKARRLRKNVIDAAHRLTRRDRAKHPALVRDLAAEIGSDSPELLLEATKLVGLDVAGAAGVILDEFLSSNEVDDFVSFVEDRLDRTTLPKGAHGQENLRVLTGQTVAEQGLHVSDYLGQWSEAIQPWIDALLRVYQVEADEPTFEQSSQQAPS